ncbi:MAG: class I SAM-dependent methyltransferase [Candidatus Paceibacterota bacterium]|jgi:predicted O-methyltransferase YrrM
MNAFEYIVNKYKVDTSKPSPTFLPISRYTGFPELLKELGVKKGVELGVYKGKYTEVLMNMLPGLDLTAVDAWTAYAGYNDYETTDLEVNAYNQAMSRAKKTGFTVMKDWSVPASQKFADESLDFVFLDGNHDFAHCIEDLAAWSPKVKKGGIVSGHDFFKSNQLRYAVTYAVPAWCAYQKVPMLFVVNGDKIPSWFYVKT